MPRRGASLYKHTRAVTVLQEGQGASFTQVQQELRCLKCEAEKLICCCFFALHRVYSELRRLHFTALGARSFKWRERGLGFYRQTKIISEK